MFCIGLTGTIASGKSTVAALFAKRGIDVINADHIAKMLVKRGQPALQQIIDHFGKSILTTEGELNRRHLRELIVNNTNKRIWLEELLHPLIRKQIQAEIDDCKSPYCIIEIPLLTDTTHYPYLNRVLLIQAHPEQQIMRLMTRDHSSREQACALLATTRADDIKRQAIANDILVNDGSLVSLREKVDTLHDEYLQLITYDFR